MRKDAVIAILAIVVVAAVCYGLAMTRPALPPTPSRPFSQGATEAAPSGPVVIRVNGEAITEGEYEAALRQLPEQMQQQVTTPAVRKALAEQLVRMKLLEQEGRKLGMDRDPRVAAALGADRMNVMANATAEKIAAPPTAAEIQKYYAANKGTYEALDLSHILLAYAGGSIPARAGAAPSKAEAMQKANAVYKELASGADFAAMARKYSDDTASAQQGGKIGSVGRGMLPLDLEARVFSIPTGQISGPVASQFGVHIFKVNSRGSKSLDEVRAGIEQGVRRQNLFQRVEQLRREAKVDFDPKFFPDSKPPLGVRKQPQR